MRIDTEEASLYGSFLFSNHFMREGMPFSRRPDDQDLLRSWGFRQNEMKKGLALLHDPKARELLGIEAGTTALDVKFLHENLQGDPLLGNVGWVSPDGRVQGTGEQFQEPDFDGADLLVAGGIANGANALARILANESAGEQEQPEVGAAIAQTSAETRRAVWGVMARVGDDEAGDRYRSMLHPDLDQSLIDVIPGGKSGLSHVRLQGETNDGIEKGTYAIRFRPGESGQWIPAKEELVRIAAHRPFNVNISYPGLFPYGMDCDDGATLAQFVHRLQTFCPMVSMDMHGPTQIQHVESALSHIDVFNANERDAARLFLGRDVKDIPPDQRDIALELIGGRMQAYMFTQGRPRLFTVTHRDGCHVVFQSAVGEICSKNCLSPYAQIPAKDTTGAGDVRFATSRLYLAREMGREWKDGSVTFGDVCRAVNIGQLSTTLHLQGEGGKAYEGVTVAKMESVVRSGRQFETLEQLQDALMVA